MIKSNYIVYDCETGGLDCELNPITQFACMVLDFKTLKEIDRWETFVKPYQGLIIEKKALEKTMCSMTDINNGLPLKDFVKTLAAFLKNHNTSPKKPEFGKPFPVGHNTQFDNGFLEVAMGLEGLAYFDYVTRNYVDTLSDAKRAFGIHGDEKINLTAACELAKIKLKDAHGAMNDVEATADLFRFFTKRLRSKKGEGIEAKEEAERAVGSEFFEFRCSQ